MAKGNPGPAGYRGVARDYNVRIVSAVALPLGTQTNHFSEAKATYIGLKMASHRGFKKVWLESELLNIINYLNKKSPPSWTINHLMKEGFETMTKFEAIKNSHVLRECNRPADHMANLSVVRDDEKWWQEEDSFSFQLWELARNDAENLSSLEY
ncbi:uncharacterized protein LOC131858935 [Cryptomeria japonica]|uniref:uncharacterized protein LOC131858935 n=1 Tax=Cryptomeria japonica TaxID=3369 RepID=UPI0027DAB42C|nr:uncharacterized protein LOC131858935 [Cryptomeria japonica]